MNDIDRKEFFRWFAFLTIWFVLGIGLGTKDSYAQDLVDGSQKSNDSYVKTIRPILENYCADCHSPGAMEGLEFLDIQSKAGLEKRRGIFASVVEQMESKAMPPGNSDGPSETERKLVTNWLKKSLKLKPSETDRISNYVVEVFQDRKRNLWMGTVADGLVRCNGKKLTYFTKKDGLPSNTVSSIAEDKKGNLWLGTHSGLVKFDGNAFRTMGPRDGLPAVRSSGALTSASVNIDRKGTIWAGIGADLFRLEGKKFKKFQLPFKSKDIFSYSIVPGRSSLALHDRKGNLWFAVDGNGVFKYDGKSFKHYTKKNGLCSNTVNSVVEDQEGNIWFACMQAYNPKMTGDGGLCRFDGKNFKVFPTVKGLWKNDLYTICCTSSGDVWIGASNTGVYRYSGNKFQLFDKTSHPHWTRNFGLQSMLEDRNGTLWFGFSGGLFRFDGRSFFNVKKSGPWEDLETVLLKALNGQKVSADWVSGAAKNAMKLLSQGNDQQAFQVLKELKSQFPDDLSVNERKLKQLGYRLIFDSKLEMAIKVFEINTKLYPTVGNTFDSLADAYKRKGKSRLALRNYRKAMQLDPTNHRARDEFRKILAQLMYEKKIMAPNGWLEEVIIIPPSFAPTMAYQGMEHLRLPPDFRNPKSDRFLSYMLAIDLSQKTMLSQKEIGNQLLIYFQGLAEGGVTKEGRRIDVAKFRMIQHEPKQGQDKNVFRYTLRWREPFAGGHSLNQKIQVKVIKGKNKHGILFVCASPKDYGAPIWKTLLKIRSDFEKVPSRSPSKSRQ